MRKNLFAAGPMSPIVDQLDAENRRVGPPSPDPNGHLGPVGEAVALIQQALSDQAEPQYGGIVAHPNERIAAVSLPGGGIAFLGGIP